MSRAKIIAFTSVMVALSLIFEVLPLKVRTPWGMNIDLVAVPIIALYLILGFRAGLFGLAAMTIGLFIISGPNTMGIGPVMKFFATLSVLIGLETSKAIIKKKSVTYFIVAFLVAAVIRDVLMILLNYYFALPLFLKMMGYNITSRSDVIRIVEEMTKTPFWLAIALPNTIQTGVDIFIAAPVVKRFRAE
ncbi:ECF transporter S component [Pyrococcus abyssi]|uniref:ECF transporter S component n=1 Tax=Pyrococcus abyssi (strain GE5 / Orsay) TaxID=272844 RepID=Q9V243_PYRAB|nr:ECF transporter S component [Pyrococcus abyssi]CAB49155.1 Hypothetical protein PAB2198 [Pyrococcus abyssi GE5]CCE69607.1 TPA: hypothetical protein PAB2198 [Pyrococcus abyssi GE5]